MFVSGSGYLYFSAVQPTDQRRYYCSVTLIASSEYETAIDQPPSRISLGVDLIVTGTGNITTTVQLVFIFILRDIRQYNIKSF